MSSRQEEKERRKREREEREAAERAKRRAPQAHADRVRRVLVVVLLGGGAALAFGARRRRRRDAEVPAGSAEIPAQQEGDLKKAAAAAGCKLVDAPNEGSGHEEKNFKPSDYKQNPPTSGNHFPSGTRTASTGRATRRSSASSCTRSSTAGSTSSTSRARPTTTVAQLETLYNEMDGGHHLLLFQNETNMPFAVAATAWDHQLGCPTMNPKVFDAIRAFRTEYIDKGPEIVP